MKLFKNNWSPFDSEISTAALPDIIFMLLFFFMVATAVKKSENQNRHKIPDSKQLQEFQEGTLTREIRISICGNNNKDGAELKIQAGGQFIELEDIMAFVERERASLPAHYHDQIIISLKVDGEIPMGMVADVQAELRKANARKIDYAAASKKD